MKIGKTFKAIARGEFLITLMFDKYFPHILFIFVVVIGILGVNLMIEQTMVRVEENKVKLNDMKIYMTHKNAELVELGRMSTVQKLLEENGSELSISENPINIIEK